MHDLPIPSIVLVLVSGALLLFCAPQPAEEPADLVIRDAKVVTVDDSMPRARALAVRDGRIAAVGDGGDVDPLVGPDTRVLELDGALVIPGFIEGHAHFMGIGNARLRLDLTDTESYEDLVRRVAEAVEETEPGRWILGRGWHQSKWDPVPDPAVEGFPIHDALSAVSPDNPVWLTHASGHAGLANAAAMEAAGVTADTESPSGGTIVVDARGEPIGIFVENAQDLVGEALERDRAEMSEEERRQERLRALRLAVEEANRKGITTLHDAGVAPETVEFYRRALDAGELDDLRLYVMVRSPSERLETLLPEIRAVGLGDDHLTFRSIKVTIDGALGSRGAWLLEPYADDPDNLGHNTVPLDELRRTAELALEHDFQLNVHAIGDRANREVLDVYEAAFDAAPEAARDARFRIEHAQHVQPEDIPRFAELDVIAAVQGIHATSDGPWIPQRLGPERGRLLSYRFRDLIDAGAVVMNGTDAPVEDVDPIACFHASVTRRMDDGATFVPEQAMTREEALRSYTINGAYGAFEEDLKGSITPGKLADLTVLSRDIMTVSEEEILDAEVLYTIVGGRIVYEAGAEATEGD